MYFFFCFFIIFLEFKKNILSNSFFAKRHRFRIDRKVRDLVLYFSFSFVPRVVISPFNCSISVFLLEKRVFRQS